MHMLCISWKTFKVIWTLILVITTILTATWQLLNYLNGEDMSTVRYKIFHFEDLDLYPSVGLCFANTMIPENLGKMGIHDANIYSRFLAGMNWSQSMLQVDYDNVSKDIKSYILSYSIRLTSMEDITIYSSTERIDNRHKLALNENYCLERRGQNLPCIKELSMFSMKCLAFDIPFKKSQKVYAALIEFDPNIFHNGTRPEYGGTAYYSDHVFTFAPHYPNQFI